MQGLFKENLTKTIIAVFASFALAIIDEHAYADPIYTEAHCKTLQECMVPLSSFRSSFFFSPSYKIKTALALFERGYYEESLPWFEDNNSKHDGTWFNRSTEVPIIVTVFPEYTLSRAIAYEKLGNTEKALEVLSRGNADEAACLLYTSPSPRD